MKDKASLIDFLNIDGNYKKFGPTEIGKMFGFKRTEVYDNAVRLKILTPISKSEVERINKEKVFMEKFYDKFSPETAYFLGQIWTDGHISKSTNYIAISQNSSDILSVKGLVYDKIGKFNFTQKTGDKKKQSGFQIHHTELHSLLSSLGFKDKSGGSMKDIINFIPDKFFDIFVRSLIDGDGWIASRKYVIGICSCHDQEWESLITKIRELYGVDFKIKRSVKRDGKSSMIYLIGKDNFVKFLDVVYKTYPNDKIGFSRKYEKYLNKKNNIPILRLRMASRNKQILMFDKIGNLLGEFKSINDAAKYLNFSRGFISSCLRGLENAKNYNFSYKNE